MHPLLRLFSLICLGLLGGLPFTVPAAQAQPTRSGTVSGRVVDAETGKPLPGAHVFFSTTTRGTATDPSGRFSFKHVPVGTQRLHASMVGYETRTLDTLLHAGRRYRLRIALKPTVIEASAVDVAGRRDDDWKTKGDDDWADLLTKFERLFIGESPEADSVTLENPGVLAFDPSWWGQMKADAGAPLVFENRALGYRVRYYLREFEGSHAELRWDGEPLFEPLTPADSAEAARWETNRKGAFRGSLRHFLLALLGDSLEATGFSVRREPSPDAFGPSRRSSGFRVDPDDVLERPPPTARDTLPAGTRHLSFSGRLRITYAHEPEDPAFLNWQRSRRRGPRDYQQSYIDLDGHGPVTVDPAGEIVEPYGATLFGYFAFERLATLLPKEYRP